MEYKGGKCQKCGYDKCENALTFHHLNPQEKDFNIAKKYNVSWSKLKNELDKCVLLCANCHAEEHAKEQHTIEDYQKWITPKAIKEEAIKNKLAEEEERKNALCAKYNIDRKTLDLVRLDRRKVQRPTKEEFFNEYEKCGHNREAMGKKYGVSGNAIKKWIQSYKKYGV